MSRAKTGVKRNVWKDPSPYGTYEGVHGSPEQWRSDFKFAWGNTEWNKETAANVLQDDSPYTILGVEVGASISDIKKAFRKLMLINHPDKGGDIEVCKKMIAAYIFLTE